MEAKDNVIKTEEQIIDAIRKSIPQIVKIRLDVMRMLKRVQSQDAELEIASEEITEAIEALHKAEQSMGNAQLSLLISQTTLEYSAD